MDVIRPDLPRGRFRRVLAHPAVLLPIGFVLFFALYGGTMIAATKLGKIAAWLGPVAAAAGVAIGWMVYRLYRTKIDSPPDLELALPGAGRELGIGLLIGFGLFSTATALVALLGGFRIEGVRGIGNLWLMLAIGIASGFFEEVLFRGVVMRHLEALIGTWGALAVTSAFFGFIHIMNPGATVYAALAIAVEAGILLGAAYLLTRRLWLAIGIHAAWNFTQGWIYSIPVSGTVGGAGLLVTTREGPDWLTGGAFGLETSVVALVVCTAGGLVLLLRAAHNGETRQPRWLRNGE